MIFVVLSVVCVKEKMPRLCLMVGKGLLFVLKALADSAHDTGLISSTLVCN